MRSGSSGEERPASRAACKGGLQGGLRGAVCEAGAWPRGDRRHFEPQAGTTPIRLWTGGLGRAKQPPRADPSRIARASARMLVPLWTSCAECLGSQGIADARFSFFDQCWRASGRDHHYVAEPTRRDFLHRHGRGRRCRRSHPRMALRPVPGARRGDGELPAPLSRSISLPSPKGRSSRSSGAAS